MWRQTVLSQVVCRLRVLSWSSVWPLFEFSLWILFFWKLTLAAWPANPAPLSFLQSSESFSTSLTLGRLPKNCRSAPPKTWLSTTDVLLVWGCRNGRLPKNTCNCHQDNLVRPWGQWIHFSHRVKSITSGISWQKGSTVGFSAMYSLKVNPFIHGGPSDFSKISIYESNILSNLNTPS